MGIILGLNQWMYQALNPVIQILKPISPLAWLPLVTMVVSAVYSSDNPLVAKSFINSAFTVTLCSLWPTLLNTTVGVANIDPDLKNVSRVLKLDPLTHVRKIVLPSAIPMIFTGLRLSLGVAWMVLIAAEMLAQNPGLGKFVWDEFQNGSAQSLARIMVAVVTIGIIGFMLDRGSISAAISTIHATPSDKRNPVKIIGIADGSTILRTCVSGSSFSTRLTFFKSGSMFATPTVVFSSVGHRLHRVTVNAELMNDLATNGLSLE
jgi:ABC-type nitrate/sulfonate/bicarbonate transport system permease component